MWASKKAELKINVGDLGCGYYKGTNLEVDCGKGKRASMAKGEKYGTEKIMQISK